MIPFLSLIKAELETKNMSLLMSSPGHPPASIDSDMSLEHENENNFTEQKFYNSVLEWRTPNYNIICERGKYFLKLGEDIGESSSDGPADVMESIKNFETLLKDMEFGKHETIKVGLDSKNKIKMPKTQSGVRNYFC